MTYLRPAPRDVRCCAVDRAGRPPHRGPAARHHRRAHNAHGDAAPLRPGDWELLPAKPEARTEGGGAHQAVGNWPR